MQNQLEKNLKEFEICSPFTMAVTRSLDTFTETDAVIEGEDKILYFKEQGEYYRLHSQDKEEESRRMLQGIDSTRDYLFALFGMGNTTLLRKMIRETSAGTKIFVFEPNVYVFKYLVEHENLLDIIKCKKFAFIVGWGVNIDRAIQYYVTESWDNLALNLKVLSLANYQLYSAFCLQTVKKITAIIDHSLKSLGTSIRDTLDGLKHSYQNIDHIITADGLSKIRGKFEGYPAVIVASGPSLDKNKHLLKQAEGKALIISCDASYRLCKKLGVKPDVIASIERYEPTYKYFYEGQTFDEELVLAAPGVMWPKTFEEYSGKKLIISKNNEGVEGWWYRHFPHIEFADVGHSCANLAYAVAKEAGCSPIILIGQDLAYSEDKFHGEDAHNEKYEGINKINHEYLDENYFWVEDIYGKPVLTNIYFNLFRNFFEFSIRADKNFVIDATEGGARIAGTKLMTFAEAIEQYCIRQMPYHLYDCLSDQQASPDDYLKKYEEIIEDARLLCRKLDTVREMAVKHYQNIEPYAEQDLTGVTEKQLLEIVEKMTPGNEIVTYIVEKERDIVTYFQQVVKATILYVKKIGNEITSENIKRNLQLQLNLMHMIEVTAIGTGEEIELMIEALTAKRNARLEIQTEDAEMEAD